MTRLPCILLLLLLTAGCAIAPESLPRSARRDQLVLPEGLNFIIYKGFDVRSQEGVFPGIYVPEREDEDGIYYYGLGKAYWKLWTFGPNEGTTSIYAGGIYLPRDDKQAPRFFHIIERLPRTAQNIDSFTQQRVTSAVVAPAPNIGLGPAVLGNVIGGLLVQAMIESEVGKISKHDPIHDADMVGKIRMARTLPNNVEQADARKGTEPNDCIPLSVFRKRAVHDGRRRASTCRAMP